MIHVADFSGVESRLFFSVLQESQPVHLCGEREREREGEREGWGGGRFLNLVMVREG